MTTSTALALREKFMATPKMKRRRPTTTLGVTYSRKMGERVCAYTPEGCQLWIELEFDSQVSAFNLESVPLIVAHGDKTHEIALMAASVDVAGHLSLHVLERVAAKLETPTAQAQGLGTDELASANASLRVWNDLDDMKRQDRATKATLLRYVCAPHIAPDASIEKGILQILAKFRKPSVWDLTQNLRDFDEEEVKTSLVNLVIGKRVFMDMSVPFSVSSEVSLQEVFDA
jgi:hypothetical protein